MTRKSSWYIILFFLFAVSNISAQQLAQYSLYTLDPIQFNPAAAGLENTLIATAGYRTQWVGIPGNPVSQRISAELPLNIISSGIGFTAEFDELGARRYSRFGFAYNYQFTRGRNKLSIGFNTRLNQIRLLGDQLRTPDGNYNQDQNIIVHNDALLPSGQINSKQLSFGAGLFYKTDLLEIGLSALHLSEPVVKLEAINWSLKRQYNFFLRYQMDVLGSWELRPSLLLRSDGVQTQAEISAILQREKNIFFGTSLRGYNENTFDAVVLMAGLNLSSKVNLAYAYDLSLSALRDAQSGSHEIVVGYRLGTPIGKGSPPPIIFNPRTKE